MFYLKVKQVFSVIIGIWIIKSSGSEISLSIRVDDGFTLYADDINVLSGTQWDKYYDVEIRASTKVLAVWAYDQQGDAGISITSDHIYSSTTRFGWKCTDQQPGGNWRQTYFYDGHWPSPVAVTINDWRQDPRSGWSIIWTYKKGNYIYCRGYLDECRSSPCQHGGGCIDGADMFSCDCRNTGYTGEMCQEDIDECQTTDLLCHNGTCLNTAGNFTCDCSNTGFAGVLCQEDIDECQDTSFLCNHGTCYNTAGNFTCDCSNTGYAGRLCQEAIPTTSPRSVESSSTSSWIAPVAGAVGGVLLVIIVAVVALVVIRRRRRSSDTPSHAMIESKNPEYENVNQRNVTFSSNGDQETYDEILHANNAADNQAYAATDDESHPEAPKLIYADLDLSPGSGVIHGSKVLSDTVYSKIDFEKVPPIKPIDLDREEADEEPVYANQMSRPVVGEAEEEDVAD